MVHKIRRAKRRFLFLGTLPWPFKTKSLKTVKTTLQEISFLAESLVIIKDAQDVHLGKVIESVSFKKSMEKKVLIRVRILDLPTPLAFPVLFSEWEKWQSNDLYTPKLGVTLREHRILMRLGTSDPFAFKWEERGEVIAPAHLIWRATHDKWAKIIIANK